MQPIHLGYLSQATTSS